MAPLNKLATMVGPISNLRPATSISNSNELSQWLNNSNWNNNNWTTNEEVNLKRVHSRCFDNEWKTIDRNNSVNLKSQFISLLPHMVYCTGSQRSEKLVENLRYTASNRGKSLKQDLRWTENEELKRWQASATSSFYDGRSIDLIEVLVVRLFVWDRWSIPSGQDLSKLCMLLYLLTNIIFSYIYVVYTTQRCHSPISQFKYFIII